MRWCRTDPIQNVDALLFDHQIAVDAMASAMVRKSSLLQALPTAHGKGWAAIFTQSADIDDHDVLPHLANAIPLYRSEDRRWWFPVGITLAAPPQLRDALLTRLAERNAIHDSAILVPHIAADTSGPTDEVDVYLISQTTPFKHSGILRVQS